MQANVVVQDFTPYPSALKQYEGGGNTIPLSRSLARACYG